MLDLANVTSSEVQAHRNKILIGLFYATFKSMKYRILYRKIVYRQYLPSFVPHITETTYHYIIIDDPIDFLVERNEIIVRSLVRPSTFSISISDILILEFDIKSRALTMDEINVLQKFMGFEVNESLNVDSRFKVMR